jgi:hypothetical protein
MIISASRRTDIPAYYSDWFYNRILAGYCTVPNPFNPKQISFVDLRPEAVDAIVFWTRNPKPLFKYLSFLDSNGYKYYFQFTLNNYPRILEPFRPGFDLAIRNFKVLSSTIGKGKVIWRYDPILLSDVTPADFHIRNFEKIARELAGFTERVMISLVDEYRKTVRNLKALDIGYEGGVAKEGEMEKLLKMIAEIATSNGLKIFSCAEPRDFSHLGIFPGKCIDDELIRRELGVEIKYVKDKGQRKTCRCTVSKDIGANETCLMGCKYCYATTSRERAVANRQKRHDPLFPSILRHEIDEALARRIKEFTRRL